MTPTFISLNFNISVHEDRKHTHNCFIDLKGLLSSLTPESLSKIAHDYLGTDCNGAPICVENRMNMVDAVGSVRTELAQKLLVKYVLNATDVDEEEARRALIELAVAEKPAEVRGTFDVIFHHIEFLF